MVGSSSGGSPSHASIEVWAIGPLRPHSPRGGTWTSGTPVRTACSRANRSRPGQRVRRWSPSALNVRGASSTKARPIATTSSRSTPCEALAELALLDPVHDRLDQRPEPPRVAGRDEVDRPAHERHAHDRPIDRADRRAARPESPRAASIARHTPCVGSGPASPRDARAWPGPTAWTARRRSCRSSVARFRARRLRVSPVAARCIGPMVPPRVPCGTGPGTGRRGRCIGSDRQRTRTVSVGGHSHAPPYRHVPRSRAPSSLALLGLSRLRRPLPVTRATMTSTCRDSTPRPPPRSS